MWIEDGNSDSSSCQPGIFSARLCPLFKKKNFFGLNSQFGAIENILDFQVFFYVYSESKMSGFTNFSVSSTPRHICVQIFKSPGLLEIS
jgi:hypothetical protein